MTIFIRNSSPLRLLAPVCLVVTMILTSMNVSFAESHIEQDAYIEPSEFEAALAGRNVDQILESLNQVKQMRYQGQILPYLLDLWNLRKDKHADLPWDLISLSIVRLEIANVLLQAYRNRLIEFEASDMHHYVLTMIHDADAELASRALWTLSIIDDEKDVPEIIDVAQSAEGKVYQAAVVTLASMCNPTAIDALSSLESENLSSDQMTFLIETRDRYASFNVQTGRCPSGSN